VADGIFRDPIAGAGASRGYSFWDGPYRLGEINFSFEDVMDPTGFKSPR